MNKRGSEIKKGNMPCDTINNAKDKLRGSRMWKLTAELLGPEVTVSKF